MFEAMKPLSNDANGKPADKNTITVMQKTSSAN
jgi:hypothetical protein